MASAVSCTVSPSVSDDDLDQLFGLVCGLPGDPCAGIATSPSNGTYGAYSMCEAREQLAFALDTYNRQQRDAGNTNACEFSGSATIQSAVQPTGSCSAQIEAAGDGTTPTGSSGSSGSRATSTSKGAAAGGMTQASLNIGSLQVGIYMVCAILSGGGMVLL